jgi:hypothetical protein
MVAERPLWQLLLEEPSDLNCDECFAVMEYYAEAVARGGLGLLPKVLEHLRRCPSCKARHRETLQRLIASHSESGGRSRCDSLESSRPDIEE